MTDRTETSARLREFFERDRPDIVVAYLFGSVARGDAGSRSDVDVAVLFRTDPPRTLDGLGVRFRLQDDLESHLGQSVDVVVLNTAPLDLAYRVLRDGVLVADRDRSLRIRFEVKTRLMFFDFEPVLRLYRGTGSTSRSVSP